MLFSASIVWHDCQDETDKYHIYSWLKPDMNFTCSGTITRVTVAGVIINEIDNPRMKLHVWKESTTVYGNYHRSGKEIVLSLLSDRCERNEMTYKCKLKQKKQVSVESGDILGIELPKNDGFWTLLHRIFTKKIHI